MLELIKDIYPDEADQRIRELTYLEKDCERRLSLMQRREEIYDDIQKMLANPDVTSQELTEIEEKLEALKRMVELTE